MPARRRIAAIREEVTHMIKRMHHTGFVVEDIDKSVEFYKDVVGLQVQNRYERTGAPISQVVGYEDAHLKIAIMDLGGGHILELIQYVNPPPGLRPTQERSVLGASHLALEVDDIAQTFDTLMERGAHRLNPPADVAPGRRVCYLQDPDRNWIELMELNETG
jgi:catechol 2,3-dioxygenase-like lactoylglutathione lyase family enzyme